MTLLSFLLIHLTSRAVSYVAPPGLEPYHRGSESFGKTEIPGGCFETDHA